MATTKLRVKVPPNSATLDEARKRVFDFFKTACRSLPAIMEIYNLYDVVTISQLRSTIAAEIRKNAHINNPKNCRKLIPTKPAPIPAAKYESGMFSPSSSA